MIKKLSVFEFVSYKNIGNYLNEFVKELELLEAINRIQPYNRTFIIHQAKGLLNKVRQEIDTRPLPNWEAVIQPEYIKLQTLVSKALRELEPDFKELEFLLAQAYPEYFQNREDLLQAGKIANIENPSGGIDNNTILPLDPETPTTTIDAPLANSTRRF